MNTKLELEKLKEKDLGDAGVDMRWEDNIKMDIKEYVVRVWA
jgi:hypothetical protein